MSKSTIGWGFVGAQVVLLAALVLLPSGEAWDTPSWLGLLAAAVLVIGLIIAAIGALGLGRSLTPTPVPVGHGELKTGGLYRYVRHPIYSGVLLIVVSIMIRAESWITLVVGIATFGFFSVKARWEEKQLRAIYKGYDRYAAQVGRFFPKL